MTLGSLAARIMARGQYPYRTRAISPLPSVVSEPPLVPLWCESCAVGWKGRPGDVCWNCGHPA